MAIIPVNPIPSDRRLYTNITPFTVRDNSTYIIVLEEMRRYINKVLIPFINDNVGGLDEKWHEEVLFLEATIQALMDEQNEQFDEKISQVNGLVSQIVELSEALEAEAQSLRDDMAANVAINEGLRDQTQHYRDEAEGFVNDVVTIPDSVTAGFMGDDESLTHAATLELIEQEFVDNGDSFVSGFISDPNSSSSQAIREIINEDKAEEDKAEFVEDAVSEWWCHPVATQISSPYERTVFGAIAADGQILACEINSSTNRVKRIPVGAAGIDDHNSPALWIEDDRCPVIAWTNHNDDNVINIKVGARSGDLDSLKGAELVEITLSKTTAYTQIHKIRHKSSNIVDCLWIFTRQGNGWGYVEILVDQNTRSVVSDNYVPVVTSPGRQCYISTADAHRPNGFNQVIRLGFGYNPAQPVNAVYYMEIDVVTGRIGSPAQPSFVGQTGDAIVDTTSGLSPLVPTTGELSSRRFFYCRPGPDSAAVSYANWDKDSPDDATYHIREFNTGGVMVTNDGWIETESSNINAFGRGFEAEVVFTLPSSIPSMMGLISMWNLGVETFFVRLTSDGNVDFAVYEPNGTSHSFHTSTAPLSGDILPGTTLGIRIHIDLDIGRITRFVSRDSGRSWSKIGLSTPIPTSSTLMAKGIKISDRPPLRVPHSTDKKHAGKVSVNSFSLRNRPRTAELAGVDFGRGEWLANSDRQGNLYTLEGAVNITSGTWGTNNFGVAGARVGYTESANYIAGMAFDNPSNSGTVLTAHSASGVEVLRQWIKSGGSYQAREIAAGDTDDARIIRPISPVNGMGGKVGYTSMREYDNTYTNYEGDWKVVTP